MQPSSVVVVGAGQAGCQVVSSLRDAGYQGRIALIGAEPQLPYQRPPLSKGHLTGKALRESLWLRPEAWYDEQGVDLHLGVRVTHVDRIAHQVQLSDGGMLPYGCLVLALGSRHREIPLPGSDLEGVVGLRTLDEADEVRDKLALAHHVVVVGGGFIGMEVAATAAQLGKEATVLEIAPQLMGRVLSRETASFLLGAHQKRGLALELGCSAAALVGIHGSVQAVDTADGRRLPADLVLLGVGAVPCTELALDAGLEVDNGIVVDELLRTSDPDIYAVGDCASAPCPFAGGRHTRLESVQNATAQGRAVAATIAGTPTTNDSVPWFWSDQADLKIQIAGLTTGHDEVVLTGDRSNDRFSVWCFAAGSLVGVESVNRPADHMAARKLLGRTPSVTADEVRAEGFDPKGAAAGAVAAG